MFNSWSRTLAKHHIQESWRGAWEFRWGFFLSEEDRRIKDLEWDALFILTSCNFKEALAALTNHSYFRKKREWKKTSPFSHSPLGLRVGGSSISPPVELDKGRDTINELAPGCTLINTPAELFKTQDHRLLYWVNASHIWSSSFPFAFNLSWHYCLSQ